MNLDTKKMMRNARINNFLSWVAIFAAIAIAAHIL